MICPYCQDEAQWVENKVIYGKNIGKSYMAWYCKPCNAWVGCHENTTRPLGTMANAKLRKWRIRAHQAIDPLWKKGPIKRNTVYKVLSRAFGYRIHIGKADIETCKKIIQMVKSMNGSFQISSKLRKM